MLHQMAQAARSTASRRRPAMVRVLDDMSMGDSGELMLSERDFPCHYVNMAHPEDYISMLEPLQPELFYEE